MVDEAKVVSLAGKPIVPPGKPIQDVVDYLEERLGCLELIKADVVASLQNHE